MNGLIELRNLVLGVAIGLLLPFTVHYGVSLMVGSFPNAKDYGETYNQKTKKWEFESKEKEEAYTQILYKYENTYFYVTTIVGIIALIVGAMIQSASFLAIGFMFGGLICIAMGYISFWHRLNELFKFISLLLALILLVFVGHRMAREK